MTWHGCCVTARCSRASRSPRRSPPGRVACWARRASRGPCCCATRGRCTRSGCASPSTSPFLTDDLACDRHHHRAARPGRASAPGRSSRARGRGRRLRALGARPRRRPGDQGVSRGATSTPASSSSSRPRSATSATSRHGLPRRCRRPTSCAARTPATPGSCSPACGLRASRLVSLHAHNERERRRRGARAARAAVQRVALVSDAGTPAISDPGEHRDRRGHRRRPQGHDRARAVGCPERSRGRRARDRTLAFRGLPAARGAAARRAPGRDRGGAAPERDLRGAPARRRDAQRPRRGVRRRAGGSRSAGSSPSGSRRPGAGLSPRRARAARPSRGARRARARRSADAGRRARPSPSEEEVQTSCREPHVGRCQPPAGGGRGRPRSSACRSASPTRLRSPAATSSLGACPAASS